MTSMESIVVYVQENNTSYRVKLPTQEICKLCLDLTNLQPLWDCPYAKDFNNFKFIGVQLGFNMPENICKTCLTKLNEIGVLLKRWQGSLCTYKKMEDNCAKIKQEIDPPPPETTQMKMTNVGTKSQDICETIKIVTKPQEEEEEGEEEMCEMIEIVTKPEKVIKPKEALISKQEESDAIMNFEMELADETEEILHIKTDLSDDAEEILNIETELPNELNLIKDTIKLEVTDIPQSNIDAEITPVPDKKNAKNTKNDSKKKVKSSLKICHKCGACVTSLTQHYKQSYQCQAKNYKCPMCNVYCNNTVKLLDHQRAYHWDQISATLFTCHICGQTFKYGCSLKRHLLVHEKGKQFMCEICGKGYTRATDLRDHKNIHLKVKPYVCTHCGKSFTSKANQYTHMMRHTTPPNSNKIYVARRQVKPKKETVDLICTICERHFSRQDFLDKHMISHGEDTRLRECRKCQIKFETVEDYRQHAETHKKREYLCPYCSKSFCSGVVLEQHTFTHTGERPFLCSLCGSKFRAPAHLKRHSMLIHNINRGKPFQCQYCEKTFALKENLLPHERIHTGEKPYGCHVCEKHFIDPSRRKKHVRRYHGEEEVKNIPSSVTSYNRS